jgi:uncharacterized protein (TIGR02284 family)
VTAKKDSQRQQRELTVITLRNQLKAISAERSDFAEELAKQVENIGGEPAASGHLSGIQHRGWRELEASIRPKSDESLVAECETGEENTRRHYDHALTLDLPSAVRSVIVRQHAAVQEALAELASLHLRRTAV